MMDSKRNQTGVQIGMDKLLRTVRRHVPWLEPWYDWGTSNVFRLDTREMDFSDESEGPAKFFELQWLGISLALQVGRTPRKISAGEVAANKARHAAYEADRLAEAERRCVGKVVSIRDPHGRGQ
ncbi:hypothetical protein VPH46_07020 [Sphingomonas sp. MJ1 (PH-R8)]|uniref:hypothetical protein n=1 Tax=Sphingomonas sp. MJ1 (PH-R8) TaxID=3112950 RepID=UPI003A864D0F